MKYTLHVGHLFAKTDDYDPDTIIVMSVPAALSNGDTISFLGLDNGRDNTVYLDKIISVNVGGGSDGKVIPREELAQFLEETVQGVRILHKQYDIVPNRIYLVCEQW